MQKAGHRPVLGSSSTAHDRQVAIESYTIELKNDLVIYCMLHNHEYSASYMVKNAVYWGNTRQNEVPIDFTEDVNSENTDSGTHKGNSTVSLQTGINENEDYCNFVEDVLTKMICQADLSKTALNMFLYYTREFNKMCRYLLEKEKYKKTVEFSEPFKKKILALEAECGQITVPLLQIYNEIGEDLHNAVENKAKNWNSINYPSKDFGWGMINNRRSVTTTLVNTEDEELSVLDADKEPFYARGLSSRHFLYRVKYVDCFEYIASMYESDANSYGRIAFRKDVLYFLPSGEILDPGTDIYFVLEALRNEILYNILYYTKPSLKLVHVGSEYFYFTSPSEDLQSVERELFGEQFEFVFTNITDLVIKVDD